jgi:hypothetical protein
MSATAQVVILHGDYDNNLEKYLVVAVSWRLLFSPCGATGEVGSKGSMSAVSPKADIARDFFAERLQR